MGCTCRCSYGRAQVFQRVGDGSKSSSSVLYGERITVDKALKQNACLPSRQESWRFVVECAHSPEKSKMGSYFLWREEGHFERKKPSNERKSKEKSPEMNASNKAVTPAIWYSFASASVARFGCWGARQSRKRGSTGMQPVNQPAAVMVS